MNKRSFLLSFVSAFGIGFTARAATAPDLAPSPIILAAPVLTGITRSDAGFISILADITAPQQADTILIQSSKEFDFGGPLVNLILVIDLTGLLSQKLTFSQDVLDNTPYYFRARHIRGELISPWSNWMSTVTDSQNKVANPPIEPKQYVPSNTSVENKIVVYNRGKFQFNPNFWTSSLGHCMNVWKIGTRTNGNPSDNKTNYDPSKHNSDGYMTTQYGGGYYRRVYIIPTASRAGNWVLAWNGTGTFLVSPLDGTKSLVSGALSGTNGRYEFTTTATYFDVYVIPSSDGAAADVTNIRFYNINDETRINAGETWQPDFIALVSEIGVWRAMNWNNTNHSSVRDWADRTRKTNENWNDGYNDQTYWGGTTAGSGDNFTATISGFTLVHGAKAKVKFDRSPTTDALTLDINDTGAKLIINSFGQRLGNAKHNFPIVNNSHTFIYDADCSNWIIADPNGSYDRLAGTFITDGVPIDAIIELCNLANCHPWFCIPAIAADHNSDYATQLATYCRDNLNAGLIPRFEVANETWNYSFPNTVFGDFKQAVYDCTEWRSDWVTSTSYIVGDGVRAPEGFFICKTAHISSTTPTKASPGDWTQQFGHDEWAGRCTTLIGKAISSVYSADRTRYQVIVGQQAFNATSNGDVRMASAKYVKKTGKAGDAAKFWCTHIAPASYFHSSYEDTEQETRWAAEYPGATASRKYEILKTYIESTAGPNIFTIDGALARIGLWATLAASYGVGLTTYEGGWDADKSGLNGHTASQAVYDLRAASYLAPALERQTQRLAAYLESLPNGSGFPALFQFDGHSTWSVFDANIYAAPSTQWDGMIKWNASVKVFSIVATD